MFRPTRLLAPLTVAAAFAAVTPAAHADTLVHFDGAVVPSEGVTVSITDPVVAAATVHLTVTADFGVDLDNVKVFLGTNAGSAPNYAIDAHHVRDARYVGESEPSEPSDLSTSECAVYSSALVYDDTRSPSTRTARPFPPICPRA